MFLRKIPSVLFGWMMGKISWIITPLCRQMGSVWFRALALSWLWSELPMKLYNRVATLSVPEMLLIIFGVSIFLNIVFLGICIGWSLNDKRKKSSETPPLTEKEDTYPVKTQAQAKDLEKENSPISSTSPQPPLLNPQVDPNSIGDGDSEVISAQSGAESKDKLPSLPSMPQNNIANPDAVPLLKKNNFVFVPLDRKRIIQFQKACSHHGPVSSHCVQFLRTWCEESHWLLHDFQTVVNICLTTSQRVQWEGFYAKEVKAKLDSLGNTKKKVSGVTLSYDMLMGENEFSKVPTQSELPIAVWAIVKDIALRAWESIDTEVSHRNLKDKKVL